MPILGSIVKRAIEFRSKIPIDYKQGFNAEKAQRKELKKLLKKAYYTTFGEHYQFMDILKEQNIVRSFKEKVPIHNYNSIFICIVKKLSAWMLLYAIYILPQAR